MQIHDITPSNRTRATRIGRGGKRGATSGRGQKGQRSRSGHKIRPALRDLIARLPKRRGFANKTKSPKPLVVNLSAVERHLKKGSREPVVTLQSLRAWGVIPRRYAGEVKVLATGAFTTAVTVRGLYISAGAKAKVEKAGGKVEDSN